MAAKTMTQLIEEAKEVRVYAPLKGRDVDLPKKRIAQLKKEYGEDYKDKFKISIKEFKGSVKGEIGADAFSGVGDDKTIYQKHNAKKSTVAHEEAHLVYGHTEYNAVDPVQWAQEEMDADLYAYKKTGEIHDEKNHLRGLYYGMTHGDEDMSHTKTTSHHAAVRALDKMMDNPEIPKEWKKDWEYIKTETRGY